MSRHSRLLVAGAVTVALLATVGCATLGASRRTPASIANGVLTPARPPAASFGADPTRTCPVGGVYGESQTALDAAAKDRGAAVAEADGALCAMAEALLSWPEDAQPREEIRTFLGEYFGSPNGAPQVVVTTMETADSRRIAEWVTTMVTQFAAKVPVARYGLASERLTGSGGAAAKRTGAPGASKEGAVVEGNSRVVLVLQSASVALDPLPRRLLPGQTVALSGTVLGDLENPKVYLSDTAGVLVTPDQAPGKAFKAQLTCGDRPGRVVVELRAEDMGTERVLTTLQLPCGGPELPVAVAVKPAAPWPDDPVEQEARMARLIDAERAQAGLPALTWDPAVGTIARATAENYRDGAKKGGAAGSVNVVQRLLDADIQAPLIEQNPAVAPSAEQAALRLLASPSHRARIMSPEVTLGGLGVAAGANAAGQQLVYVSQLFVKVQPVPDVAASRSAIREAIDKKRAAEKLPALATDPALEKLAADYAALVAAAGGPPPKARTEEFVKSINKGFKDITFLVDARIDLADFAEDPNALAKGRLVGLGGALGRHPRLGKNTLFVVLIIANPAKPAGKK